MKAHKNISQKCMADFLGVSQQYVSLLIKNRINPRPKKLLSFADKTNTDLSFWILSTGPEKEKAIKKAYNRRPGPKGEAA